MILPGTLVQRIRRGCFGLREGGVYTVHRFWPETLGCRRCEVSPGISLVEIATPEHRGPAWCACGFRILAPPITEADRLEMTAPDDGAAPANPLRTPAKTVTRR